MEENKKRGWKGFFGLVRKSKLPWGLYIIGLIFGFAGAGLGLLLPQYTMKIIDGQIFDNKVVFAYIGLGTLAAIIAASSALFGAIAGPIAKRNIQQTVWTKLMRMPIPEYSKQPSQQLISRITVDPVYIDIVVKNAKATILATFTLVSSIAIMYNMNVKLTLALLPVIPYILIVTAGVGHYTQKTQLGVQARFAGITAFFAERLQRMRLVKSFGKEEEEIERGDEVLLKHYTAEKKRAIVDLFAEPLMQSTQAIVVGTVLIYGGILVGNGEMRVSELIGFYMYVQFIHNNVLKYGILWQTLKQARGATENIADIVESEDEDLKRQKPMAPEIGKDLDFENVSFGYTDRKVLNNLNLTIPAGKVTAFVGPSGCGKSTILKLVERFYKPGVGRVMIGNTPAEAIHVDDWRRSIAYVAQASPLISGTIRDNITYGLDHEASIEELRQAAEHADALSFIEKFPEGFDTEVGEFGSKLSGGQRQRIAIARAFIKNAPILLLDEATASLDVKSEHAVQKALKELMKNRTTIIVAHDMDLVKEADQIIVIDKGQAIDSGTHKELFKNNELYRQLVDIQTEKDGRMSFEF